MSQPVYPIIQATDNANVILRKPYSEESLKKLTKSGSFLTITGTSTSISRSGSFTVPISRSGSFIESGDTIPIYDTQPVPEKKQSRVSIQNLKKEFENYSATYNAITMISEKAMIFIFTSVFYGELLHIESTLDSFFKKLRTQENSHIAILYQKYKRIKNSYRQHLLHLYTIDKLTIEDQLLDNDTICELFGIRKRVVRFSPDVKVSYIEPVESTIGIVSDSDSDEDLSVDDDYVLENNDTYKTFI
jgi:hypothetical protein